MQIRSVLILALLVACNRAQAHVGVHPQDSLIAGLTHPFSGLDHLLAMIAVGLWASQLGGRFLLIVPASFVASMAFGALIGASGASLPFVESGMALSVLILGLLLTFAVRAPMLWAGLLIALFALFHGYAHGAEMPSSPDRWSNYIGFLSATAFLHAAGIAVGAMLKMQARVMRVGGAAIGLAGLCLLVSA
jgi:urease accessory protein